MPRYTLIVSHFDDFNRLKRLLRSVPTDRGDVEILVVDDCSPDQDALAGVEREWPIVHWLKTDRNSGAGAARNVGLRNAAGEYLVFADSDDEFIDGAFDVFDEHVRSGDDLVYFLAEAVQEADGSPSNRADGMNEICRRYLDQPSETHLSQLKLQHVNPVAKVYSRAFIERIGTVFEETRVSNDISFNVLSAFQADTVRVVPEAVYRIYRRSDSLTSNPGADVFLERIRCQAHLATGLKSLGIDERPSATGWMLASLGYGPVTAFNTWRIFKRSDLPIDWGRVLQAERWLRFFRRWLAVRTEKKGG